MDAASFAALQARASESSARVAEVLAFADEARTRRVAERAAREKALAEAQVALKAEQEAHSRTKGALAAALRQQTATVTPGMAMIVAGIIAVAWRHLSTSLVSCRGLTSKFTNARNTAAPNF